MQLGQAAVQQKNFDEAVAWFTKAAEDSPKDPQTKACLGQSLCWLGKREEGLAHLHQSGQLILKKSRKSRDIGLALDMVDQLQYWNDFPGALEICKQAVQINPGQLRGYQLLALTYSRLNQKKSALAAGRQALKLAPNSAVLSILLATLEAADGLSQEARQRLEKVLQNPLLTAEERFRANKELARILDKLGEYDRVFANLHAAAEIAPRLPEVKRQDAGLVPKMLEHYKTEFDRELLGRWANTDFPADQPAPVFLLGFMRTGTTLTQEVLAAHPEIFVADETDLIVSVAKELNRLSNGQGSLAEQLRKLDLAGVLHLRAFYWHRARALYGDKTGTRLLLDKTTMNTIDLGLINCIFPDAKLVFLLRDPRDVCLSCFMQTMLPTPSTVQLLSWESTARFYAQVMDWWLTIRSKLTMSFIEFRYEDAVFNFEPAFRKVFDFLDLDWNPAVAEFHKKAAGKYIASPSFSQVAQPLYSSSVGRWRHYRAEYAAILPELQTYIDEFGYEN
ncbi:sulfotransferase [Methylomonas methanica]|uniref:Sulfotransferase n=2 Tax=Methylomonas TaxID=416 RepID=A0A140E3E8_9GAMM|nr:sulfotransferase [Methylomonas denitrificans]OAI05786.1 sulfotransferase [Methylomonas methanica]